MKFETAVPIGQGAMGEVFKSWDPDLERFVALKLLRRDDPEAVERMFGEARAQARIDHPNVCKVYGMGETEDGRPYISMQLVEGQSLDRATAELGVDERVRLMVGVADAVQAAHSVGLIHRDLKPSNILVEGDEESGLQPYVLDFGIARELEAPGLTITGEIVGTPAYMSPEQARGEVRTLDRRSDIFSLGVNLYELLGGRSPWTGANKTETLIAVLQDDPAPLRKVAPHIPRDLETIVNTCLQKDPDRRYPSARALVEDLNHYLDGEPITARRPHWGVRLRSWVHRHKLVAALAAVLLIGAPAGALKYTLDVRAERRFALAAGEEAEELLDFMLEDLYQRLLPLGRTDVLEVVAQRALAHHERFATHDRTPVGRHRRALAFRNLALVLESQGKLADALRTFRRAHELMLHVTAAEPGEVRWYRSLAALESALAEVMLEQNDTEGSLEACDTALSTARSLVKHFGEDKENVAELWQATANMGWHHHQSGDLDAALIALNEALAIAEKCAASPDADNEWLFRLSVTHGYRGMVEEDRQGADTALADYRMALAHVEELARREPDNTRWAFTAQLNHSRLGHVFETTGDLESSEREYRLALAGARALVELDDANAKWRRELAVALSSLGQVLRRRDLPREALSLLQESLAISRRLVAQESSNDSLRNDLAWDLMQVGSVHSGLDHIGEAATAWEEALAVITPVAERTDNLWYRDTQVTILLHLGRVEEARPLVKQLLSSGWEESDFSALVRRYGLL